jgi:tetratricopeptide (TPR) repeat protein
MDNRAVSILFAVALLGACIGVLPQSKTIKGYRATRIAIEHHKVSAREFEIRGELGHALKEWGILAALTPGSRETAQKIHALKKAIAVRVNSLIETAEIERRKGHDRQATVHLLKALVLDPTNDHTKTLLKQMEMQRVLVALSKPLKSRLITDVPLPPDVYEVSTERPESINSMTSERYQVNLQRALQYRSRGKFEEALRQLLEIQKRSQGSADIIGKYIQETKAALADRSYKKGVQLFRIDLEESIKAFQQALIYDPGHEKAKLYLSIALKLHKKEE